ncbi:MAG: DUF3810 domain-containing protein [Acidobacteriota bacterium]
MTRAPRPRRRALLRAFGYSLLPLALLLRELAFGWPHWAEQGYGQWLYPQVARVMGSVNNRVPFSLAEGAGVLLMLAFLVYLVRQLARSRAGPRRATIFLLEVASFTWVAAGIGALAFLFLWGFNYARPSLAERMRLPVDAVEVREVLDAGRRCAVRVTDLHRSLGAPPGEPTRLPMDLETLNDAIDLALGALALPGDRLVYPTSRAKPLAASRLLSYLGLSGIFVAFTGEPSINALVPDASLPMVVAHEKAHQRGITDEGEANLVAFLACAGAEEHPYLRYAAYLNAASRLLAASSVHLPEEAGSAWEELGEGPKRDLAAIREFWSRYRGRVSEAADRLNDTYLRSFGVREGVKSYERVVELLVALDREGRLIQ